MVLIYDVLCLAGCAVQLNPHLLLFPLTNPTGSLRNIYHLTQTLHLEQFCGSTSPTSSETPDTFAPSIFTHTARAPSRAHDTSRRAPSRDHHSSSSSSSSSSDIPWPGSTYTISTLSTGAFLTLTSGTVTLSPLRPFALRSAPPPQRWQCVEANGWLGFRDAASGLYLGYDAKGRLVCRAAHAH
jgi:hypothetical protein